MAKTAEVDLYTLICTIIGPIIPVGDTHDDSDILENLESMIELLDKLLNDVAGVYFNNKDSELMSKLNAAKRVASFFSGLGIDLEDNNSNQNYKEAYYEIHKDIEGIIAQLQNIHIMRKIDL